MGDKSDIEQAVKNILTTQWASRKGQVIPSADDLTLGNDAVLLDGTILYADLDGSTKMVDGHPPWFAAEIYKAYLLATAKLIRTEGGEVAAYDGDRVMGVFIGARKNTSAVRCALKINWVVQKVINRLIKAEYPQRSFAVKQVVGVDTSSLWIARTGVRGANDLVWVGQAANYAAKLTELGSAHPTWITHRVFDAMHADVKHASDGREMWEKRRWTPMNELHIYCSNFWWRVD